MNSFQQALSKCNAYKLYHKDIYMPQNYIKQVDKILKRRNIFIFSKHMKEQSNKDYKHEFNLKEVDKTLRNIKQYDLFEIETQFDKITKFCIRIKFDDRDLCIAITICSNGLLVKTIWRNDVKDLHNSLDYSKYEKGGNE